MKDANVQKVKNNLLSNLLLRHVFGLITMHLMHNRAL